MEGVFALPVEFDKVEPVAPSRQPEQVCGIHSFAFDAVEDHGCEEIVAERGDKAGTQSKTAGIEEYIECVPGEGGTECPIILAAELDETFAEGEKIGGICDLRF